MNKKGILRKRVRYGEKERSGRDSEDMNINEQAERQKRRDGETQKERQGELEKEKERLSEKQKERDRVCNNRERKTERPKAGI